MDGGYAPATLDGTVRGADLALRETGGIWGTNPGS